MKWGLTQGMIGRKLASLAPSATALGPNTYLSQQDFLKMLGIAFVVHVLIFSVVALFPHEKVNNIPVRALSFKLGDRDKVAAYGSATGVGISMNPMPPAPVMQAASADAWHVTATAIPPAIPEPLRAPVKPVIQPRPRPTPKVIPITEPERQMPVENRVPPLTPLPLPSPAIASTPQQYVREVGTPSPQLLAALPSTAPLTNPGNTGYGAPDGALGGEGAQSTMTPQTEQVIRERYTQEISGWVERHRYYPAGAAGRQGRAVVRVRIDRRGYVRYYAIEESSGSDVLDGAAIDMIRRANPMPAAPANYPTGDLIEFLIPINLRPA